MDKEQIALELTLKLIEKGRIIFTPPQNIFLPEEADEHNRIVADQAYRVFEHLIEIQQFE